MPLSAILGIYRVDQVTSQSLLLAHMLLVSGHLSEPEGMTIRYYMPSGQSQHREIPAYKLPCIQTVSIGIYKIKLITKISNEGIITYWKIKPKHTLTNSTYAESCYSTCRWGFYKEDLFLSCEMIHTLQKNN